MPIEIKTLGTLIDELCTTSQKIFKNLDALAGMSNPEGGRVFKETQTLNRRRSELIQAIDRKFGEGADTITDKTYH